MGFGKEKKAGVGTNAGISFFLPGVFQEKTYNEGDSVVRLSLSSNKLLSEGSFSEFALESLVLALGSVPHGDGSRGLDAGLSQPRPDGLQCGWIQEVLASQQERLQSLGLVLVAHGDRQQFVVVRLGHDGSGRLLVCEMKV